MLKSIRYHCRAYLAFPEICPEFHEAVYIVLGKNCYFSGIGKITSTISAAEEILSAISKSEGVSIGYFNFYDIQTYKGYDLFMPGEFTVDKLKVEVAPSMEVVEWKRVSLDAEVINIFAEYIGINLVNMYSEICSKESDGLIIVQNAANELLFIRPDGTPAFEEKYWDATPFREGFAFVKKQGEEWTKIDVKGKKILT